MSRRPEWNNAALYDKELSKAATFGDIETVRRRLAAGADANARDGFGGTPLMMAAANGGLAVARVLIDAGAEVNVADVRGVTPLYYFIARGDVEAANLLLDLGADAKVRGGNGISLVHDAVLRCRQAPGGIALIRRLIAAGADPHQPNEHGVTPAQVAQTYGVRLDDEG